MGTDLISIFNPMPKVKKNGFANFKIYCTIKGHMSGSYDMVKYGGKNKISQEAFDKRNDKFFFGKVASKFTIDINYLIFIHNFLDRGDKTIIDIMDQDAIDIYYRRNGNIINAEYNYKTDCKALFSYLSVHKLKFIDLIKTDKSHPLLLRMVLKKHISLETLMLLDSFMGIIDKFNRDIDEYDILWETVRNKLICYRKLLIIDREKAKQLFIGFKDEIEY